MLSGRTARSLLRRLLATAAAATFVFAALPSAAAADPATFEPADLALAQGEVARARELYRSIGLLATDPEITAQAAEQAAWCSALLGHHDRAATELESLLRQLPGNGPRRARLTALLGAARLQQALAETDPDERANTFRAAGEIFRGLLGDDAPGDDDTSTAGSALLPDLAGHARYDLARCLFHQERYAEVSATLAPLLARPGTDPVRARAGLLDALAATRSALLLDDDAALDPALAQLAEACDRLDDRILANESAIAVGRWLLEARHPAGALDWVDRIHGRKDVIERSVAAAGRMEAAYWDAASAGMEAPGLRRDLERLRWRLDRFRDGPDPRGEAALLAGESLLAAARPLEAARRIEPILADDALRDAFGDRALAVLTRACGMAAEPRDTLEILRRVQADVGPEAAGGIAFAIAQSALDLESPALAADALELSLELAPDGPRAQTARYQAAVVRLRLGEHEHSAQLLEEYLDTNGEYREAWYALGCARAGASEYAAAADAVAQAVDLAVMSVDEEPPSPSKPEAQPEPAGHGGGEKPAAMLRRALPQLARLEILAGRPDRAIARAREFEARFPESAGLELRGALVTLADALEATHRHAEAAATWERVAGLSAAAPIEEHAALWRAAADRETAGDRDGMRDCLLKLAASDEPTPHRRASRQKLLRLAIEDGDLAAAGGYLELTPPSTARDLLDLADAWRERTADGKPGLERAAELYRRASMEFSEYADAAEALYWLSRCLEGLGRPRDAQATRARITRDYRSTPWADRVREDADDQ